MPLYEYECRNCGIRFERQQRMMDAALTLCPECGEDALFRVIQPVGIIFKGSGFYVTDNRGKSSTGPSAAKNDTTKETSKDAAADAKSDASQANHSKPESGPAPSTPAPQPAPG
jgi:putative FmdB family regulatory protein